MVYTVNDFREESCDIDFVIPRMGFFELFAAVDSIRSGDASYKAVGMSFVELFDRFAVEERESTENIYIFSAEFVKFLACRDQSSARSDHVINDNDVSSVNAAYQFGIYDRRSLGVIAFLDDESHISLFQPNLRQERQRLCFRR